MPQGTNEIYELGPYRISVGERVLRHGDQIVPLTPKCFDTLLVLAQHAGAVVDKEKLIRLIWPDSFVEEGNLAQNIFTLRKTLGQAGEGSQYIQTIPKRGYRLVIPSPVTHRHAAPAEGDAGPVPVSPRHVRRRYLLMAGAIAIILAVLVTLRVSREIINPASDVRFSPVTVANSISYAVISPDGTQAAYVANETEGQSLWVRRIAGIGAGARLAGPLPGHFWGVSYSPAGDYLYYAFEDQSRPVGGTLFRIAPGEGQPQKLLVGVSGTPSFSPDGSRLVFKRYEPNDRGYLLTATAQGTEPRILATSSASYAFNNYQWAADGRSIYYVEGIRNSAGSTWSTFEISTADGAARLVLPPRPTPLRSVNWLDRSEVIALIPDEDSAISQIWLLGAAGFARRLTNGISDYSLISITADGRTILANSVETQDSIWITSTQGVNRKDPIYVPLPAGSYNHPVWVNDGHIVYVGQSNIWLTGADGLGRRPLLAESAKASEPVVSADGRTVVFVLRRHGSVNLWQVGIDGRGLRQVTRGRLDWHPALSPDGGWVAYASIVDGQWALWKARLDGAGSPIKLVDSCAEPPAISPDGKLLAYADPRGNIQVRSFADGSPVHRISASPDATDLHWSADGKTLAFVSHADRSKQFWTQPIAGGPAKRIGEALPTDALQFDWSRDGSHIVYLRRELKVDLSLITNYR